MEVDGREVAESAVMLRDRCARASSREMRPNVGGAPRSAQPGKLITFFWEGEDCVSSFVCEGRGPGLRTVIGDEISFPRSEEALFFGMTEEIDVSGTLACFAFNFDTVLAAVEVTVAVESPARKTSWSCCWSCVCETRSGLA